jgi:hypothetical protein
VYTFFCTLFTLVTHFPATSPLHWHQQEKTGEGRGGEEREIEPWASHNKLLILIKKFSSPIKNA